MNNEELITGMFMIHEDGTEWIDKKTYNCLYEEYEKSLKEAEHLKCIISSVKEDYLDEYKEKVDLEERISKAIELMYNKGTFNIDTEYGKVFSDLLDILKGEDNED